MKFCIHCHRPSSEGIVTLNCGHSIHTACMLAYKANKNRQCPVCLKTFNFSDKYYTDELKVTKIKNGSIRCKVSLDVYWQNKLLDENKLYACYIKNVSPLIKLRLT